MSKINDGGQAFTPSGNGNVMSLREHFVGRAMQALIIRNLPEYLANEDLSWAENVAALAVKQADALIAELNSRPASPKTE